MWAQPYESRRDAEVRLAEALFVSHGPLREDKEESIRISFPLQDFLLLIPSAASFFLPYFKVAEAKNKRDVPLQASTPPNRAKFYHSPLLTANTSPSNILPLLSLRLPPPSPTHSLER